MDDFLRVGVITTTHGIKGEVKVFPTTDNPARFEVLKNAFIVYKNEKINVTIKSVKFFKQYVIVKFKEFDDINLVEKYKSCDLIIDRKDAVELEENEYFICDLIGLNVITDEGEDFGVITDVLTSSANDIYVVKHNDKEVLLPVIDQCVLDVNIEEKKVTVHIMDGLLDLN